MSQLFQDMGVKADGQKVCLATTAYDSPDASYTFSIQRSREHLHLNGVQTAYFLLSGNCHVDDARNVIVQEFLLSDCTDLVFLDADVSWRPDQLLRLCRHDKDIVGGVYPFRSENKSALGDMPVRMIEGNYMPGEEGLLEVEGLPTGFMRIKRHVLETLGRRSEQYWNKMDRRSKVPILFERCFEDGIRWGGDLNFCRKWRKTGGKIFADYEMQLGHTAKSIVKDSLGAALRRQSGVTLKHVCNEVRKGKETFEHYQECMKLLDNPFGAHEDILATAVMLARKAEGPILEMGSGLTTVLMAAANPKQTVYCIEHDPAWAETLRGLVKDSGVTNVGLCLAPIKDGWYDIAQMDGLPGEFDFALVDGPPRYLASRMGFYEHFGEYTDTILIDDMDDAGYTESVSKWAYESGRELSRISDRVALLTRVKEGALT